jgi:ABC-type nitrate/sulfonate/bicarbonate transport system substrate-binding protein
VKPQTTTLALLRGVCQTPAYAAAERGFFRSQDIDCRIEIASTAWLVPGQMARGEVQFAVIPWTRVAAARSRDEDMVLVCGSGCEEAALVVRAGLSLEEVRSVAVPQEGGIKDLTAAALMQSLGWSDRAKVRMPSGDGAILALVGEAADAASMVEPYATALEQIGIGSVVRRTGDVWPQAPGCSLATTRRLLDQDPDLVRRMVAAFVEGARFVEQQPDEAAAIAEAYIGINRRFVRQALEVNRPSVHALSSTASMDAILTLMIQLGYIDDLPVDYADLSHLDAVTGLPEPV